MKARVDGNMKKWGKTDFTNVSFGHNVTIMAEEIEIGPNAFIGDNVSITSHRVKIGHNARIEQGTEIRGLGQAMVLFSMGDQALIGFDNQIFCPSFSIGDYSQLHNSGLNTGYKPLTIGHNCWIGQSTVLNCTEVLTIGNNVRIGTQSQLWTHVASGELLEGCTLFSSLPLVLEDDVWVVGGAVISPGLSVRRRSIIMTGAVLTKSTEPSHTYAGIPAKDVTDKLPFWNDVSVDDKMAMMEKFIGQFVDAHPKYKGRVLSAPTDAEFTSQQDEVIAIFTSFDWKMGRIPSRVSVFDLTSKVYSKKRSEIETDFLKFNVGYRARFVPFSVPISSNTADAKSREVNEKE